MRCFVLSTGRAGSLTVAKAFKCASNYTVGHESLITVANASRLSYPDNHIESDNRLSWFVGSLAKLYPDAVYIHLLRDSESVIKSYMRRWDSIRKIDIGSPGGGSRLGNKLLSFMGKRHDTTIVEAFARGVLGQRYELDREERQEIVKLYVKSVNDNIEQLLCRMRHYYILDIQDPLETFSGVWHLLGAEGQYEDAIKQLQIKTNVRTPLVKGRKGL